jgi:hypothetical protein
MTKVSYSQYGMYTACQEQYKLNYIDKLGTSSANIHTIFGSSMHETIQHFLDVMYNVSKKQALTLNLEGMLKDKLVEHFTKENEKMEDGMFPCTKEELGEFFEDGKEILSYFTKKLDNLYSKSGFELVAIEMPLNAKIKEGVHFIGFIDIVLKDLTSGDIIIIDLKTSTRGWSKYQKNDKVKTSQMLLYKKFYSEKYDISLDKIKVEYQILKRKISEGLEYPIPRISKFVPANGKPSVNSAWNGFMEFVDSVFDDNGNVIQEHFPPNKGKSCDWCEFKERKLCSVWK